MLAALAHFTVHVPARLSLYSSRRQPAWHGPTLCKHPYHDVFGRPLARRELDFRDLGWIAWHIPGHQPHLEARDWYAPRFSAPSPACDHKRVFNPDHIS